MRTEKVEREALKREERSWNWQSQVEGLAKHKGKARWGSR